MLTHIHIENIAVIEDLSVDFCGGMSVLTGEAGAGKSIIIDSINLILGARTNKALVRYGERKARVQAVFDVNGTIAAQLAENGLDTEDNQLVISREITDDGKNICRINSTIVPLSQLREIGSYLINIHGQHDNQALLTPSRHIDFLDKFAKNSELKSEYKSAYDEYRLLENEIEKLSINEREREQRIDLLTYQTGEIEAAKLTKGEYANLSEQRDVIANAEKISAAISEAYGNLYDGGESNSAYDAIGTAVAALAKINDIDSSVTEIYTRLNDIMYSVEDLSHEIREYGSTIEYDERLLNDIEARLDLISNLKRKYGANEEEILAFYERAKTELDTITDSDSRIAQLEKDKENAEIKLKEVGERLTLSRKKSASEIEKQIETALAELDMPRAEFKVEVRKNGSYGTNGVDDVEFMISTNPGEPPKPLVKVASGGELSRVMLAIKSILADDIDTLIFDEIDTGVSGSAAQKIAVKMAQIAKNKQVICITHLAVLAAMADNHFLISKNAENDKTSTTLTELSLQERERELARIIDGGNITETALKHAKEMLKSGYLSKI